MNLEQLIAAACVRASASRGEEEPPQRLPEGGEWVERYAFEVDVDGILRPQWWHDPFTGEATRVKPVVWQMYEWRDRMGATHSELVACPDQQAACNRVAELKALPKPKKPKGWAV